MLLFQKAHAGTICLYMTQVSNFQRFLIMSRENFLLEKLIPLFSCFRELRKGLPGKIFVFLCSPALLLYVVFIVFNSLDETDMLTCGIMVGLLQFSLLSTMCWMAVEGWNIYMMVVEVTDKERNTTETLNTTVFMMKAILFAFGRLHSEQRC